MWPRGEGGGPAPGCDGRPLWLVINLDRSPDRLAAVSADLAGLGIAFARVPAVDGLDLSPPLPGVDPALYRRSHGRAPLPGEVGCFLSHLKALRAFLSTPHRHAVVLEDDAVVTRAAADLVSALAAPGAPDDWDLVKLEAHHARGGLAVRRLAPGSRLCAMARRSAGSAAYLVNRAGGAALLGGLLPMRFPYDVAFERGWDFGIRVRAVLPPPVATAPVPPVLGREAAEGVPRRAPAWGRVRAKGMYAATALCAAVGSGHPGLRRPRGPASFDAVDAVLADCVPSRAGEA